MKRHDEARIAALREAIVRAGQRMRRLRFAATPAWVGGLIASWTVALAGSSLVAGWGFGSFPAGMEGDIPATLVALVFAAAIGMPVGVTLGFGLAAGSRHVQLRRLIRGAGGSRS